MRKDFREAAALPLLGAHVKLLALIDIEEEGRRLGLIELLVAALGLVEQIGKMGLTSLSSSSSTHSFRRLTRAGSMRIELPGLEKCLDQGLDRLDARPDREKAPAAGCRERPAARDAPSRRAPARPGAQAPPSRRPAPATICRRPNCRAGPEACRALPQASGSLRRSHARGRRRSRCPPRSWRRGHGRAQCAATARRGRVPAPAAASISMARLSSDAGSEVMIQ